MPLTSYPQNVALPGGSHAEAATLNGDERSHTMFEIRDERENVLDTRPTFQAAEQRLEELCADATRQAAASGEGTRGMTLRWTIYDTDAGAIAGWMSLSPDDSGQPYTPISDATPDRDQDQP